MQIPKSSLTISIDKKIDIIFSKKRAKKTDLQIEQLILEAEYQIKEVFNKYGHLLK